MPTRFGATDTPTCPECKNIKIPSDEGHERLNRALKDLVKEDQWIADFIKRLNYSHRGYRSQRMKRYAPHPATFGN